MIIHYNNKKLKAEFTTEHPQSHYNIPVLVDEEGNVWDRTTCVLNNVIFYETTKEEREQLDKML